MDEDLAADMQRQPDRLHPGQAGGAGVDRGRLGIGNAELVRRRVPVVILAWVPASTSGLTRSATRAVRPSEAASAETHLQFLGALDVELADVLGDGQADFARGLADAGEHDVAGRQCRRRGRGAIRPR